MGHKRMLLSMPKEKGDFGSLIGTRKPPMATEAAMQEEMKNLF
jgi:hypothetical protein